MHYSKPLECSEWSNIYNTKILNQVIESINNGKVQVWAEELCKIIHEEESCLEIGCGSGISSLWLAKNKRKVSAIDYSRESVELVQEAAKKLDISIDVKCADATKKLPFKNGEFDVIFQCGLLEHFTSEEQIELLKNWKKYSKRMVSMVPNAASLPYHIGKQIMEKQGTWIYGYEKPVTSMMCKFERAGIRVEKEYSIGTDWAMKFLPSDHYLRKIYDRMKKEGYDLNKMMQGYLLVTIGSCE